MMYESVTVSNYSTNLKDKLDKVCTRLKSEGFTILNCQYINERNIIVFYF